MSRKSALWKTDLALVAEEVHAMIFDFETLRIVGHFAIVGLAIMAIAKISRECSAERLRRGLRAIELELFEVARQDNLLRTPAYSTLNREVRAAIAISSSIHWRRWLLGRLGAPSGRVPLVTRASDLTDALGWIDRRTTRARIEVLLSRAQAQVHVHLLLGGLPFLAAAWHLRRARPRTAVARELQFPGRARDSGDLRRAA